MLWTVGEHESSLHHTHGVILKAENGPNQIRALGRVSNNLKGPPGDNVPARMQSMICQCREWSSSAAGSAPVGFSESLPAIAPGVNGKNAAQLPDQIFAP